MADQARDSGRWGEALRAAAYVPGQARGHTGDSEPEILLLLRIQYYMFFQKYCLFYSKN